MGSLVRSVIGIFKLAVAGRAPRAAALLQYRGDQWVERVCDLHRAADSGHDRLATDRGGERGAAMFTLIETAKLNHVDPQAWLADVLRRIYDHPAARLSELLR